MVLKHKSAAKRLYPYRLLAYLLYGEQQQTINGGIWIHYTNIRNAHYCSLKSLQEAILELEEQGFLQVTSRVRGRCHVYLKPPKNANCGHVKNWMTI